MENDNGLSRLSKGEKLEYLKAIAAGEIEKPKYFYPKVIQIDKNGLTLARSEPVNKIEMPYKKVIILPDNGR